jgi:glycosyltransferase involved in cell wall biosynthesis
MLNTKKLVIAAAISNISPYAQGVFDNIKRYISLFKDYVIVLVESNSRDNTLDILKHYKNQLKLDCYKLDSFHPYRTIRIAQARNTYIDIIRSKYSDYDYVLMLDFNDASTDIIKEESILSNFSLDVEWDMVCANQNIRYYDLWALRHEQWMPYDCWRMVSSEKPDFMTPEDAHNFFVKSRLIHIPPTSKPIKVQSAFGGAAFVKMKPFLETKHEIDFNRDHEVCEWISFCSKINNIYINPAFINQYKINRHVVALNE